MGITAWDEHWTPAEGLTESFSASLSSMEFLTELNVEADVGVLLLFNDNLVPMETEY